jgi:hypothetical protein
MAHRAPDSATGVVDRYGTFFAPGVTGSAVKAPVPSGLREYD